MLLKLFSYITILIILNNSLFSQTSSRFQIVPIPGNVNTPMQEFGPSLTADGKTLYFYSKRNSQYTDIYKSKLVNGRWSTPSEVKEVNSPYDDQSPYVFGDESFMIFSSNRDGSYEFRLSNGQVGISRDLYYSEKVDGEWSIPATLSDLINTDEMEENPFYSGDYLYFTRYPFGDTSQAKIFRSKVYDNNFLAPEELPSPINQRNSSNIAAIVSPDGKYLYFSSNRSGGFGGYDIYRSKILPNGNFGEPENLGNEINTEGNEAYLIINPVDNSFIFCRKKQDENYDMFVAKQIEAPKSKEVETPVIAINPNFPIEKNKNSKNISPLLPKNETEEKELNSSKKETKNQIEEDLIVIQKRIDRDIEKINEAIKDKKKITLNSINFETNSPFLLRESYPTLNALSDILLKNPDIKIKVTGHTDLTGDLEANKKLSWDRAESVRKYLVSKGVETKKIIIDGKGSTQPLVNSPSPEASKINRRTEFEVLE
jgi:outer membrane protein OmpA-like peptidoglycan-associated protein/Tol biopolymer transport system component